MPRIKLKKRRPLKHHRPTPEEQEQRERLNRRIQRSRLAELPTGKPLDSCRAH